MLHPRYVPQSTSAGRYRDESSRRRLCFIIIAGLVLVLGGVIVLVVRPRHFSQASNIRSPTASPVYDSEGAGKLFFDFTDFPTASPEGNFSMTDAEPSISPTIVIYDSNGAGVTFPNYTVFPSSAPNTTLWASPIAVIQDSNETGAPISQNPSFPSSAPSTTPTTNSQPTNTPSIPFQ